MSVLHQEAPSCLENSICHHSCPNLCFSLIFNIFLLLVPNCTELALSKKQPVKGDMFLTAIGCVAWWLYQGSKCSFLAHFFPAKGHIDKRMAEIAERISRGEKVEGKYLTYYLAQEKLSMKSIYGNVTELLLAGVDTVSILRCFSFLCRSLACSAVMSKLACRMDECRQIHEGVWWCVSEVVSVASDKLCLHYLVLFSWPSIMESNILGLLCGLPLPI